MLFLEMHYFFLPEVGVDAVDGFEFLDIVVIGSEFIECFESLIDDLRKGEEVELRLHMLIAHISLLCLRFLLQMVLSPL